MQLLFGMSTVASALVQFVNTNPDYYCPVCSDLLLEGFLTKCGHHLCYNCCYPTHLHHLLSPTCPVDAQPLTIFPDNKLTNQIASSLVYCAHSMDGCKWIGPYRSLQDHLNYHNGYSILCSAGCGQLVLTDNVTRHLSTSCTATIICSYCRAEVRRCYYQGHLITCPQFPMMCVFGCGRGFIPRNKMKEHYQSCDQAKQAIATS